MIAGYSNKILKINLTTKTYKIENILQQDLIDFIGGSGLATQIIAKELPKGVSPYSPQNIVVFATGPFQGSKLPGSAKWVVASKSPLTNTFAISAAGAFWGLRLKSAGYDAQLLLGNL